MLNDRVGSGSSMLVQSSSQLDPRLSAGVLRVLSRLACRACVRGGLAYLTGAYPCAARSRRGQFGPSAPR